MISVRGDGEEGQRVGVDGVMSSTQSVCTQVRFMLHAPIVPVTAYLNE